MSQAPQDHVTPSFLTHFEGIEDPRQQAKVTYPLNEIFLLVLCAVISCAEGWTSIALYGEKRSLRDLCGWAGSGASAGIPYAPSLSH